MKSGLFGAIRSSRSGLGGSSSRGVGFRKREQGGLLRRSTRGGLRVVQRDGKRTCCHPPPPFPNPLMVPSDGRARRRERDLHCPSLPRLRHRAARLSPPQGVPAQVNKKVLTGKTCGGILAFGQGQENRGQSHKCRSFLYRIQCSWQQAWLLRVMYGICGKMSGIHDTMYALETLHHVH